jgi:hypothetical protein
VSRKPVNLEDLTLKLKKAEIAEKNGKAQNEKDKILIDKIEALRYLLGETTPDPDTTVGSETKYKSILDEGEMELVKDKLFELIKQL